MIINVDEIKNYLLNLQLKICQEISFYEKNDSFRQDEWQRPEGGGGITCVLRPGKVFEGAGVNFSHVVGQSLPASASALRPEIAHRQFEALGVSSVIHPQNPFVPTCHLNVRFFNATKENEPPIWWFGGGFDLTPYYPFQEDVIHWHQMAKRSCENFGEDIYPFYKKWADKYFYLPHRQEPRGVGGLFFDDLNQSAWGWDFAKCFAFMQSVGNHFWQAYGPIVERRHQTHFSKREKEFQLYRRGRYVEFNLIYDRGTLFGLQSGGNTESILMSLPPQVSFEYRWQPEMGSKERSLYDDYLIIKDWV